MGDSVIQQKMMTQKYDVDFIVVGDGHIQKKKLRITFHQ